MSTNAPFVECVLTFMIDRTLLCGECMLDSESSLSRTKKIPKCIKAEIKSLADLHTHCLMLYKPLPWRLGIRKPPRQVRPNILQPLVGIRDRINVDYGGTTRDDIVKMQDVRVRMIFRGDAAEVIEEVVRARREIWGGRSGRKFPMSRDKSSLQQLTC
jgi:hypothetical protein